MRLKGEGILSPNERTQMKGWTINPVSDLIDRSLHRMRDIDHRQTIFRRRTPIGTVRSFVELRRICRVQIDSIQVGGGG